MTPEEKVIEKIRKTLIADTTINSYVKTRVYSSHISSILEPKFPAISLHLLFGSVLHPLDEINRVRIQIDAWFPSDDFNATEVFNCLGRIRSLLHKQDLTDSVIGLVSYQSLESQNGPIMYEPETKLLHLPTIYEMVVK